MRKMFTKNSPTIKHKLIGMIIGHLLLFSILIFTMIFWFQNTLEQKVSLLAKQSMETLTENIEVYINDNVRLSNTIATERSLLKLLQENPDFSSSSAVWPMVQLYEKLKSYSMMNNNIYAISIYNEKSGKMLSSIHGIYDLPRDQVPWITKLMEHPGSLFIGSDLEGIVPNYSNFPKEEVFSVIRKFNGRGEKNVLLISSKKQMLSLLIGDLDLWKGTGILISDSAGGIVYTAGHELFRDNLKTAVAELNETSLYTTIWINNKQYIVVQKKAESPGWFLSMYIPYQELMKDVLAMKRLAIWILIGVTILAALIYTSLYLQIFNPIKKLIKSMQILEKGLPFHPLQIKRLDELGFLQQRFNNMVVNEQQMRRTIYEEQLHKKEIELKFLQSQVNPHFLYNTLDSIYWVAEEKGAEEISEVILDLSKFFRLSLSRGKDFVTVKETCEHLECYLRIQQFRHTDKFNVTWRIDPEVTEVEIMKLMLQPVVENAIIHGLEKTSESCELAIEIGKQGEFLTCTFSDTGIGMSGEQLDLLMKEIHRDNGPSGTTYGLKNLYHRLKILYGEDMSFQIWSKPGIGTKVTISIRVNQLRRNTHGNEINHC